MRVTVFLLSPYRRSLKASKDASKKVASHLFIFRNSLFGKQHAAPDFSEGTWRGFSIQVELSLRSRPRIVSLRLDKFVFSLRSSNSHVRNRENELPRPATWTLSVVCVPMLFLAILLKHLVALALSFGVISSNSQVILAFMRKLLHGMGLELQ